MAQTVCKRVWGETFLKDLKHIQSQWKLFNYLITTVIKGYTWIPEGGYLTLNSYSDALSTFICNLEWYAFIRTAVLSIGVCVCTYKSICI